MTTSENPGLPPEEPVTGWRKYVWWWAAAFGIAFITIQPFCADAARRAPPPLIAPGPWQLTGHDGKPFGSVDLQGKVVIADFMFTSCPSICPKLTKAMQEVQKRFVNEKRPVHFVSFSVNPTDDTPEVLRAHIKKAGLDTSNWTFVTGTEAEMRALLVDRLKLHIGTKTPQKGKPVDPTAIEAAAQDPNVLFDIAHTSQLALFDQRGDLRAMVDIDDLSLARLVSAADLLLDQGPDA